MPVDSERISRLLGVDEHEKLDHKRKVDLNEQRELIELTKDVAAMMAKGGDILIGTDDAGEISGEMTGPLVRRFDEANLRNKLERFIDGPLHFRVGSHRFKAGWVVIIYIPPSADGIAVVRSEGSYKSEGSARRGPKIVFRPGDVFVRHGSKSERWNRGDVTDFINRIREQERKRVLDDGREIVGPVADAQRRILVEFTQQNKPPPPDSYIVSDPEMVPDESEDWEAYNLFMVLRMAIIDGSLSGEQMRMLEEEYYDALANGVARQNFDWPNGKMARIGENWDYPNGKTANIGEGGWYWPNGKTARIGETWYYPNGKSAFDSVFWQLPIGKSVDSEQDLIRHIRTKCSLDDWTRYRRGLEELYDDCYTLALIELAWSKLERRR